MRLDYVKLNNFFNHSNTFIDFTSVGSPVLINGSNGAGKSSAIVESLTYALFGETRLASVDDAIRNEEDAMSVTVGFNLNGQNIEVTRSKKRNKSQKLKLIIDKNDVTELLTETQTRLDKLIGLSYDTFKSSVLLRQDDSNFFVKAKPDQRKQIIAEILNLSQFERLEKIAKEKRANHKTEIKATQIVLASIENSDINELVENIEKIDLTIESINSKINKLELELDEIRSWNAEVNQQIKTQNEIKLNNQKIKIQIESIQKLVNDTEKEIETVTSFISNFKDPSTFLKQAQEAIENYQQDINDKQELIKEFEFTYRQLVEDLLENLNTEYNEIKEQLQPFDIEHSQLEEILNQKQPDTECSKCKRPYDVQDIIATFELNKKKAEERISELSQKEIKPRQNLLSDLKQKIKDVKVGNFKEGKVFLEESSDAQFELEELKKDLKKATELFTKKIEQQRQYDISKEKQSNLTSKILEYKQQLEFLNNQIMSVPEITLELKDEDIVKTKLLKQKSNHHQALTISVELKDNLKKAKADIIKKEKLTFSLKKYKEELELLETLCQAFSKNGIPASIIGTVLPEIQDDANVYLSKMSDKTFELTFNTSHTLKNGDERGTLDVSVFDGYVWRNFDSLSGGEAFRVSLSIRLALSKVLSRRAGVELNLLILDEPASTLDPEGRDMFCSTIKSLSSSFERIILMSHIPQLMEEFDNRINLSKSQEGTKVL